MSLPPPVAAATARAAAAGFAQSCEPAVGRLLAVLVAHLPPGAAVLELGTGFGVGTGWILSGLGHRTDVTVTTVERDPATARSAADGDWPAFVTIECADALEFLAAGPRAFDLIFADSIGGKWEGLDRTVAALRPGGLLLVDDMTPDPTWTGPDRLGAVRAALTGDPGLVTVELAHGSGVILATRRQDRSGPGPAAAPNG